MDSYSKILGVSGAPIVVILLLGASTVAQAVLLDWIFAGPIPWPWFVVLSAGLALPIGTLQSFRKAPSAAARKRNEAVVSLSMMMGYLVVVVAMISHRGVVWL